MAVAALAAAAAACGSEINVEPGTGGSGTGTSTGTASGTSSGTATGTSTGTASGTSTGTGTGTGTGMGIGAQPPQPPEDGIAGDGPGYAFVIDQIFLGDTDLNGSPNPSAWKSFGFNLDGKVSTKDSTDLCTPSSGGSPAAVYPDGDAGIDNAWGKLLLPIWTGLSQDYSAQANDAIDDGSSTYLLEVPQLGLEPSYVGLTSRFFRAGIFGGIPAFDGSDVWPIGSDSLTDPNDPTSTKWLFPESYVNQHVLVMSPAGTVQIAMPFGNAVMPMDIHHAVIAMEMAPDRSSAVSGVISGILDTEEHIAVMQEIAGSFDVGLCSATTFASLADQIRQASDVLVDGTQDPSQTCNGVSIGLGFTATAVQLGNVGPNLPTPPDVCP